MEVPWGSEEEGFRNSFGGNKGGQSEVEKSDKSILSKMKCYSMVF